MSLRCRTAWGSAATRQLKSVRPIGQEKQSDHDTASTSTTCNKVTSQGFAMWLTPPATAVKYPQSGSCCCYTHRQTDRWTDRGPSVSTNKGQHREMQILDRIALLLHHRSVTKYHRKFMVWPTGGSVSRPTQSALIVLHNSLFSISVAAAGGGLIQADEGF